jgi:gliding motility-associated-like protein
MINFLKTCCLLMIIVVFQKTALSQQTYLKSIETRKNNWKIFVFSSNNQPIIWEPDSLVLAKYDKCGNTVWKKQYQFPFPNRFLLKSGFKTLKDGKFAFVTMEDNSSIRNSRITLINSNGNVAWSNSFSMTNYSIVSYSVMQNSAGDLFVYGNASPIGGGTPKSFVYKMGLNGTIVWTKSYCLAGIWGGAILTSDQGLLMRNGLKFTKINSTGNIQWATQIDDLGSYYYSAPIEVIDGYIFSGTNSGTSLSMSFYKIDKLGNLTTTHKKTINLNSIHRNLVRKTDTSFICLMNASLTRNLPTVVELDHNLNLIKKNTIHLSGTPSKLIGTGIALHANGTPIITGLIDSVFNKKSFFAVLNTNYELGCDTIIFDSMFVQSVAQTSLTATSQNLITLVLEDTNYLETPLKHLLKSVCSNNNFSLDLGADTTICPGSSLKLANKTNSTFDQFNWSTGATSSTINISKAGKYWVTATNSCSGVTLSDTIEVKLYIFPVPIDSSMDTVICNNQVITLNAQIPLGTYRWQDNSTLYYYNVTSPGNYFVDITSENCTLRFYYTINSCEDLFIPNVFSPNGDDTNDLFVIKYLGFKPYHLLVYNRWGGIVFESNDRTSHWDGKFKDKEVSDGVYFYILSIGDDYHKGNVTVFR